MKDLVNKLDADYRNLDCLKALMNVSQPVKGTWFQDQTKEQPNFSPKPMYSFLIESKTSKLYQFDPECFLKDYCLSVMFIIIWD